MFQISCIGTFSSKLARKWLVEIPTYFERVSTNILRGSVATSLRFHASFYDHFIANFMMTVPVKEFRKSINIMTKT